MCYEREPSLLESDLACGKGLYLFAVVAVGFPEGWNCARSLPHLFSICMMIELQLGAYTCSQFM